MRNVSLLAVACLSLLAWTPRPAAGQVPGEAKLNVVHPLPPQAPPWLEGYALRWPVRVLGEFAKQQDCKSVVVSLPTGGWVRPDAADLAVQAGSGKLLPLAVLSHDPTGDTIVQFKRNGDDPWYWVYGVSAKPPAAPKADVKADPAFHEGVTAEVRAWEGDDLGSWAKVRAGLEKSSRVLGNAVVTDVVQQCNPARPSQPNHYAVSYRGFLAVKNPGAYRFLVNAEDASFLFIDGFKVCERPGVNPTLGTIKVKERDKLAGTVDLKPGVHAFEVHQAVGSHPGAAGICALLWAPPGQPKFAYLTPADVARPLYARAAALEGPAGELPGPFVCGLDDTLEVPGLKLFLFRFTALGPAKDDGDFAWDFGDGTAGKGRSVTHVYFKEADYAVTLTAGGSALPPFRQHVNVWAEPGDTSPLSLGKAVKALEALQWQKLEPGRVREIFTFLNACEQPNRWPLLDAVARHLLAQKDLDLDTRSHLYVARMEALTRLGRASEALKLGEKVRPEFARTPALQVRLQLAAAAIHQYHFKDAAAASRIYKAILDEHSRVEHPNLRLAAVRWGDLFAEAGDLVKAGETYRLAATLGGEKLTGPTTTEASTRGALLRIAEQKLRAGDIHATRQLLEKVELEYPGRRLDGLYCFLRAESDRHAGRYEDALRYYEMIFKLPQWAGYRDRATHGIADTYLRLGDLEKAQKWFADLKEGFPKYFESQKGAEVEKLIAQRLERVRARGGGGAFFKGFVTGFEPDEPKWFGDVKDNAVVRGPGIEGPYALLADGYSNEAAYTTYQRTLKNLTPGGTYWVEIWYRDLVRASPPPPGAQAFVQLNLTGTEAPKPGVSGQPAVVRNSYGRWHKVGAKLKVPMAQDFDLTLHFYYLKGVYLFDGLRVLPVSDREQDALLSFQEGPKSP
jgi:tetratricopeptide (TPR) repeat protein